MAKTGENLFLPGQFKSV